MPRKTAEQIEEEACRVAGDNLDETAAKLGFTMGRHGWSDEAGDAVLNYWRARLTRFNDAEPPDDA